MPIISTKHYAVKNHCRGLGTSTWKSSVKHLTQSSQATCKELLLIHPAQSLAPGVYRSLLIGLHLGVSFLLLPMLSYFLASSCQADQQKKLNTCQRQWAFLDILSMALVCGAYA